MFKFTLYQQATVKFPEAEIKVNTRKFLSKMGQQSKNNRNGRIDRHIRTTTTYAISQLNRETNNITFHLE